MQFKKKSKIKLAIPTASMPDIIFMLLIFFISDIISYSQTQSQLELKEIYVTPENESHQFRSKKANN